VKVVVEVPASSANLGVGFDALALALDLRLLVEVETLGSGMSELQVSGEGAGRLGLNDANRFVAGLRRGLLELGGADPSQAWRIEMDNQIPLGRGLGSSAAAVVAGLLCAEELAGRELGPERLLTLAVEIEGHPDNVAAALLGGFVVVTRGDEPGRWHTLRFEPPSALRAVIFVPERELPTSRMRAALPSSVPREDAVHNLGRAAMLVAAMARGELGLLSAMCDDRLHEPYRATIYPEFPGLVRAALDAGALGAALSGAGSTVIALCATPEAPAVLDGMAQAASGFGLSGAGRVVVPRLEGARVHR
jgi:homoserine kinase